MSNFSAKEFEILTSAYRRADQEVVGLRQRRQTMLDTIQNSALAQQIRKSRFLPGFIKKGVDSLIGCYSDQLTDFMYDGSLRRYERLMSTFSQAIVQRLEQRSGEYPILLAPMYLNGEDVEKPVVCEMGYQVGDHTFRFERRFEEVSIINGGPGSQNSITIPENGSPIVRANIIQIIDPTVKLGIVLEAIVGIPRATVLRVNKDGPSPAYYLN